MLRLTDSWDLAELERRSNISVRTIRFYQNEGLLPSPGTRGKSATYGQSDLDRLLLIKGLQRDRRMLLPEIRDLLLGLDDAGVARELQELERTRDSAANYARSVRHAAERSTVHPEVRATRMAFLDSRHGAPAAPTRRSRDSWERISITPTIELHVRSPLSHRETKLVSRLVELADRLINTQEGV